MNVNSQIADIMGQDAYQKSQLDEKNWRTRQDETGNSYIMVFAVYF